MRPAALAAGLLVLAAAAEGQAPKPALDFSGTWKLDMKASVNVSTNMRDAVLDVEQKGDRIRVAPQKQSAGKLNLAADEIVVDGRPYEKAVGGGKGIVTARWSADGRALEMELTGGPPENPRQAVQVSRWTLSADRSTWVRETRTTGNNQTHASRLVFRREAASAGTSASGKAPAPAAAPTARPTAAPTSSVPTNPKK